MTPSTTRLVTEPELRLTRMFDAPRQLVWDAWTRPEHLERWQGAPEGMTVTLVEKDLRPGGRFKLCMRAPDGAEYWLQGEYLEVVPPELLVFTHTWMDAAGQPGKATVVRMTFDAWGRKTEVTLHQTGFASEGARDGHEQGWGSTLDRLGDYLAQVAR